MAPYRQNLATANAAAGTMTGANGGTQQLGEAARRRAALMQRANGLAVGGGAPGPASMTGGGLQAPIPGPIQSFDPATGVPPTQAMQQLGPGVAPMMDGGAGGYQPTPEDVQRMQESLSAARPPVNPNSPEPAPFGQMPTMDAGPLPVSLPPPGPPAATPPAGVAGGAPPPSMGKPGPGPGGPGAAGPFQPAIQQALSRMPPRPMGQRVSNLSQVYRRPGVTGKGPAMGGGLDEPNAPQPGGGGARPGGFGVRRGPRQY